MTPFESKDGTYNVDHFAGIAVKYLNSTLVQTYHASTFAADLGYLVHAPETGWSAGLSALNLGGKLKYADVADPLPASVRTGVAWQGGVPSVHNVIAALDGEYLIAERIWHIDAGVEYFWLKTYGVRLGYQFHDGDQGGLTIGIGYRWKAVRLRLRSGRQPGQRAARHLVLPLRRRPAIGPGTPAPAVHRGGAGARGNARPRAEAAGLRRCPSAPPRSPRAAGGRAGLDLLA